MLMCWNLRRFFSLVWLIKYIVADELNKLVPWEVIDNNVMENMVKVTL
jgi:hypothetical protein